MNDNLDMDLSPKAMRRIQIVAGIFLVAVGLLAAYGVAATKFESLPLPAWSPISQERELQQQQEDREEQMRDLREFRDDVEDQMNKMRPTLPTEPTTPVPNEPALNA